MPIHRMPGEPDPYAIDFRPGSTVKSRVEGEMIISEVTFTGMKETHTTMIVWPIDVVLELLTSLQLPELARWTGGNSNG